ncbi:MAG: sporulation protein YqfD [Anaerovoracaceae bacterium]
MILGQSSFSEHYLEIRIEGFKLQEMISRCMKHGIRLKDIKVRSDIELYVKVSREDFEDLKYIAGKKYRITVISEKGLIPWLEAFFYNKGKVCGMLIFAFILYFQSLFVSEVRIEGYEKFTEKEIRECLKEGGLYEGCRKDMDLDKLKLHVYDKLGNVSFVGINIKGCLAEVRIVEGTENLPKTDKSRPCDIVADREGYIYKVIPEEGIRAVDDGVYVSKGDVLISGTVPLKSTAYGRPESALTERFVHAEGEVLAKVPYRFVYNQPEYKIVKQKTGNAYYKLGIKIGDKEFEIGEDLKKFEVFDTETEKSIEGIRPFPYSVSLEKVSELSLKSEKRSRSEIEKEVNRLLRADLKEIFKETPQILTKGLYFSREKNIIEVSVMLETLQKIGIEQEIVVGEQSRGHEEASGQ